MDTARFGGYTPSVVGPTTTLASFTTVTRILASSSRKTPSALARAEAGARCPATISLATWTYLARHIERAFVRHGTRESLRQAVRRATAEMQAYGVGGAAVCRALERAVTGHPACARFDRMLIMTGEPYSRTVIAAMQEWALAEPGGLPNQSA
jgi:hypothetical protein